MSQDASTVIGGPAIVTFNGATFYTEKEIKVKVSKELKKRSVQGFGSLPPKIQDVKVEISFQPTQFKNLGVLWPYFASLMGTRIFGNSDKTIVVQSMTEGLKYTWSRGAVTKSPNLGLGIRKDLLGEVTLTALKANATELSGATAVVALDIASAFSDTSFDVTKLYDLPYAVSWGASPFDAITTEDGVDVEFEYELEPVVMDGAVVDMWLKDVTAKATLIPVNLSHTNLLTLARVQGVARGTALAPTNANDLVIQGPSSGDPKVTLVKAFVTDPSWRFGMGMHAAEAFGFEAARTFSTGAVQAIASVTTVP